MSSSAKTFLPPIRIPSRSTALCAFIRFMRLCRRFGERCQVVAADGEGVEIPQDAAKTRRLAIGDNGNFLLAQSAMRPQGLLQRRQIVPITAGADHLAG